MSKPDLATHEDAGINDTESQPVTERGRRKRAAIVAAARIVFEEVGFNDARIADIARKAKASYGSFYTYFDSKEEIFREVVNAVSDEMFIASSGAGRAATAAERIEWANRAYLESYAKNARMMGVMRDVSSRNEYIWQSRNEIRDRFVSRAAEGIRRFQADGLVDIDVDIDTLADILGGTVERFVEVWVNNRSPEEIEAAMPVLTLIWARAIGLKDLA